jgi:molybdopterin/thiamine biosynthesis adenylyltransferase
MNILAATLHSKTLQTQQDKENYRPEFFRIWQEQEKVALSKLLEVKPYIKVSDTIQSQLKELAKTSHPSQKLTQEEIESFVQQYLAGRDISEYGVWVYYPWSEKLVHILDEKEFVMLRTNRNKYKITDEEAVLLAEKKIGVIGLSVGQSVSLTLAMERSFGELRIADYDDLEITNLNRLRSGIHNMGLLKTVLVAREIAEIDPFLKVTCFHNGITEENIDAFLTENGKLDILIDECDSIDIKILCRVEAKKRGIPVVMEASDRGTIDVERFDLEPDRSIIHGWLDHLKIDFNVLKNLKTSEDKVPYMLPIAGIETLSPRMKASALEVGQSIVTWPQLASGVALGGGVTADICRRILLDDFHQSGRYFIDIEELIGDPAKKYNTKDKAQEISALDLDQIQQILKEVPVSPDGSGVQPNSETVRAVIEAAAMAPSAGNNQPWKWYFDNHYLYLFHDLHRSISFGDFKSMASYMALGAAIENASLKAGDMDFALKVELFPSGPWKNPIAKIGFAKKTEESGIGYLSQYLSKRHTNRYNGTGIPIPKAAFNEMQKAIAGERVKFLHVTSTSGLAEMADIIGTSERLRVFISEGHFDLFQKELRWDSEQAIKSRDGLDLNTFELSIAEHIGLRLARDPEVADYLHKWDAGKGLERLSRRSVNTSSGVGVIAIPRFDAENLVNAGRALERIWLVATKYQIAVQPMLAPILHFARIMYSENSNMKKDIEERFMSLYQKFVEVMGLSAKEDVAVFLFRIGFAREPEVKSYRLPLEEIYYSEGQG